MKNKIYNCLNCNKIVPFKGYTYTHKYCNNQCQLDLRSVLVHEKRKQEFLEGKVANRPRLRKILSDIRGYKCECCGISDYNGQTIVLQVDHINGNAENNNPENLRLLCPNCHSQTETFTGKNRGKGRWSRDGLAKYYQ
jgi:5-methylcytosine-specific restriction endonuclease McrA